MILGEIIGPLTAEAVLEDGSIGYVESDSVTQLGEWLVLVFYPADFTFVCPTEVLSLNKHQEDFRRLDAKVWAVSTDGAYVHKAWLESALEPLWFPLVADRNHVLSETFDCLDSNSGMSMRCTVIIDPNEEVRYYSLIDNGVGRNTQEILRILAALQAVDANDGCVACEGWEDGDELLTIPKD